MEARKKIVLDPGHGGEDSGAVSCGIYEHIWNLHVSHLINRLLIQQGFPTLMTRMNDKVISLSGRAKIANEWDADIFISIHHNSFTLQTANGFEIFYASDKGKLLGGQILRKLVDRSTEFGMLNRGLKRDTELYEGGLAVLRKTIMPAILVEVCFISNEHDREVWLDGWKDAAAAAVCEGLVAYVE